MLDPTPSAAATPASLEPISPEQLREINLADEREQRFLFAGKLAAMNGYGLAIFAALALMFGLFDLLSWLLAGSLGMLAYTELRGRRLLAQYDRSALMLLLANQLSLIGLVFVYAGGRVYFSLRGDSPLVQLLAENPGLGEALASTGFAEDAEVYYRYGILSFYALVALVTLLFQGGCAYYYFTRRTYLEDFLARTPGWVIEWKRQRARARA